MDLQDLLAPLHVGRADGHLAIEASRPQQRGIENVGPVRRRDDDDALVRREAVHLDEELVQRLLALFVAERRAAAGAADRVELVEEDDARRVAARVLEQLADPRRADARVHLDEVGSAREEERGARFAGDRPREQSLAGSGRPDEQHALRDASADRREPLRLAEEVDDLLYFFFRLVDAGDVRERHGRRFRRGFARLALQRGNSSRRHAIHREAEQADEPEPEHERAVAERRLLGGRLHVDPHAFSRQVRYECRVRGHEVGRRDRSVRLSALQLEVERVAVDDHLLHRAAVEPAKQIGEGHLRRDGDAARAHDEQRGPGDTRQHGGRRNQHRTARKLAGKHKGSVSEVRLKADTT